MSEKSKSANIRIRIATMNDLQDIYNLEKECFAIPWSLQSIENDLSENSNVATYLVATDNDKVLGYIGMWQVLDEAQVTNLAVSESFRGRGIGRLLVNELSDIAKKRGARQLTLEVRSSNAPARSVYNETGFVEIAKRKSYYKDNGEDAIIMLKNISTDPT